VRPRPRALLSLLARQRLEERCRPQVGQLPDRVLARLGDALVERRRLVDHGDGIPEQHHRLVAVGRRGIDLGPILAVCHHAVEADAGGERRLAVALALLDVGAAEPAPAVLPLPAEQRTDDELPGSAAARRAAPRTGHPRAAARRERSRGHAEPHRRPSVNPRFGPSFRSFRWRRQALRTCGPATMLPATTARAYAVTGSDACLTRSICAPGLLCLRHQWRAASARSASCRTRPHSASCRPSPCWRCRPVGSGSRCRSWSSPAILS
jgi:hypothetical protein